MPENTESNGHALDSGREIIPRAVRKRNSPARTNREAMKRYNERLLSFIAKAAQKPPAAKSKNAKKTEIVDVFSSDPSKNDIPKIIKQIPAIKTILAITFRLLFEFIIRLYTIFLCLPR